MNTRERFAKLKRSVAAAVLPARGADQAPHAAGDGHLREVIGLAWPIIIAMLGDAAMGLVDTKLVGALGPSAIAGVGLALTVLFVGYTLIFGLQRAVKIRTAYGVGEGTPEVGLTAAAAGAILGALVGCVVLVISRDGRWIFEQMGADPALVGPATDFLRAHGLGAPALGISVALVQHRQGLGDSRTPMVVGLVTNVLNAMLAYALIHGRFGLPSLGVAGAGYATATAITFQAAVLSALWWRDVRRVVALGPIRPMLREIFALGAPTSAQFGLEMLAFTTFTVLLGSIAASELAAHQIALSVLRACFLPGIAVAEAASVLVGKALGAGRLDQAGRAVRSGLMVAMTFMTTTSLALGLSGTRLARLFTDDPEVIRVTAKLLWIAALFQTTDAITIVLRGALRGAKDVRYVALVGILAAWSCIPTAAYFLGKMAGLGAAGGWLGFVAETTIAATLLAYRWKTAPFRSTLHPILPGAVSH